MECAQTPESWEFISESKVYCFQSKTTCIPVVHRPTKSFNSKHKLDHRWWEKLNQLRKELQSVCHVYRICECLFSMFLIYLLKVRSMFSFMLYKIKGNYANIWRCIICERFVFLMYHAFNMEFIENILERVNQLWKIPVEWLPSSLLNGFVLPLPFAFFSFFFKKYFSFKYILIQ